MTICIAGIAENKKIVALTDKMLTIEAPVRTAFEISENDKAIQLEKKVVAMFAGDVLKANAILKIAKAKITPELGVVEIANKVQEAYQQQLLNDIENDLLQRFGLTRESFISKQKELNENLVRDINNIIGTCNLGVEIIVAGLDRNNTPQIFQIRNPGVVNLYNSIGYCCIGSGAQHATFSLIESHYNPSLSEEDSVISIFQAKKRAEYDPGVGELTDVILINDEYIRLKEEKIEKMNKCYKEFAQEIIQKRKEGAQKIKSIIYGS